MTQGQTDAPTKKRRVDDAKEAAVAAPAPASASQQVRDGHEELALPQSSAAALSAWLTVERSCYLAIGLVALMLRLFDLGHTPVGAQEAQGAWPAWQLAQGQNPETVAVPSALLLSLQWVTFWLFGSSEFTARIWPALAGVAVTLMPYGLRHHLGRTGAIAAAALLAISPTLVFFSRRVDGVMLAAACMLATLIVLERLRLHGNARALIPAAAGLALLLTTAPAAYTFLLALVLYLGLYRTEFRPIWAALDVTSRRHGLITFILVLILTPTTLLLFMPGLGATADMLGAWAARWSLDGNYSWWWLPLRLLLDELLLLILAVAGIVMLMKGLQRPESAEPQPEEEAAAEEQDTHHPNGGTTGDADSVSPWHATLVGWTVLAFLLGLLAPSRQPEDLAPVLIPLALLAGPALAGLLRNVLRLRAVMAEAALLYTFMLVLSGIIVVWLAQWTRGDDSQILWVIFSAVVMIGALLAFYYFWAGRELPVQIGKVTGLTLLLLLSLSALYALSFDQDHTRRSGLVATTTAHSTYDLVNTIEMFGAERHGDIHMHPIHVLRAPRDALLAWKLREFAQVRWGGAPDSDSQDLVISFGEHMPALGNEWTGQSFVIKERWTPTALEGQELWRWLLYRQVTFDKLEQSRIILWTRLEN